MSIKTIISNLRWWASYCEKGGQECYAAQALKDAADLLEKCQGCEKCNCGRRREADDP